MCHHPASVNISILLISFHFSAFFSGIFYIDARNSSLYHLYFGSLSLISKDLKKSCHYDESNKIKSFMSSNIQPVYIFTYYPQILCFMVLFTSVSKQIFTHAFSACLLSLTNSNPLLLPQYLQHLPWRISHTQDLVDNLHRSVLCRVLQPEARRKISAPGSLFS